MKNYKIAVVLFLLCILFSCDKYDLLRNNPKDPKSIGYKPSVKLSTNAATAVSTTSATSGGIITSDQGVTITAKGVCWNTSTNPTITNSKTSDGTGVSSYTSNLTGLTGSTTYYVRAYVTTSTGTTYADNTITFTTLAVHTAPVLTTAAASAVGLTNAYCGGTITSNGLDPLTARGVCWSTTANPTIANSKTNDDSTSIVSFTHKMTPLNAGTTYHVRAYATNVVGTGYGNDVTFTTLTVAGVPVLTTTAASSVAMTTAIGGGNITFDGGASITERGVCWGTAANPSIALPTKTSDGTSTGVYTSNISGLTTGVLYHIRAFATNSAGTGYGADLTFTTSNVPVLATVTTAQITEISLYSATGGGNVIADGGATVTAKGICWATTTSPTISSSKTTNGSGIGSFTGSLTLSMNTTYYVRAYATNSVGTSYGTEVTFKTLATLQVPIVSNTVSATLITAISASSGGTVSSDGGYAVTARGVCWSTSANPTLPTTSKTTDASGIGSFVSNITGLFGSTIYHVRAYATNYLGTGYGPDITFTTDLPLLATISTTAYSNNLGTSITSGGNISSDGGGQITARGVCWGANLNPSLSDNKTSDATGSGTFTSNITGLTIGTSYHLRAYATNAAGTAYGQDIAFTTPTMPTVSTTTPTTAITPVSATSGGTVSADGGASVTEMGICWSTSQNPTVALTTKTVNGGGVYTFNSYLTGLLGNTTYYVRAYATNSAGTAYGTNVSFLTLAPVVPTLTTTAISAITLNTATSGGDITSNGGAAIIARGVCWNVTPNPTIANWFTPDGNTSGVYTSNLTSLSSNTTYYLRAYATNSAGTAYGTEIVFKTALGTVNDADGNTYYTVGIGTQVWMRENLRTTKFRDNNLIANVTDNTAWSQLTTSAYCWYSNDVANKNTNGALYNWYTVSDSRGLCPTGWHVPSDAEWTTLVTFLGGTSVAGGKLKITGTTYWYSPNTGATNETGFSALGSGNRTGGSFSEIRTDGLWWSSTPYSSPSNAYNQNMYYSGAGINSSLPLVKDGNSIRCLKD
jgi:uncharacterized protein (TIGR02145 family)